MLMECSSLCVWHCTGPRCHCGGGHVCCNGEQSAGGIQRAYRHAKDQRLRLVWFGLGMRRQQQYHVCSYGEQGLEACGEPGTQKIGDSWKLVRFGIEYVRWVHDSFSCLLERNPSMPLLCSGSCTYGCNDLSAKWKVDQCLILDADLLRSIAKQSAQGDCLQ